MGGPGRIDRTDRPFLARPGSMAGPRDRAERRVLTGRTGSATGRTCFVAGDADRAPPGHSGRRGERWTMRRSGGRRTESEPAGRKKRKGRDGEEEGWKVPPHPQDAVPSSSGDIGGTFRGGCTERSVGRLFEPRNGGWGNTPSRGVPRPSGFAILWPGPRGSMILFDHIYFPRYVQSKPKVGGAPLPCDAERGSRSLPLLSLHLLVAPEKAPGPDLPEMQVQTLGHPTDPVAPVAPERFGRGGNRPPAPPGDPSTREAVWSEFDPSLRIGGPGRGERGQ